jgi:parallel beta-helix repeat protein
MKKTALVTLMFICWIAVGVVCVQPIKAQYQGNIAINADGSITPSTASIQQVGDVYYLTSDMTENVWVYKSNITLDGNGHTLIGAQLSLLNLYNSTVRNFIITNGYAGIILANASNVTITNNTITGTGALPLQETGGIYIIDGSSSNIIVGNILMSNQVAILLSAAYQNVIVENNFTDNSLAVLLWSSAFNNVYHNNFVNNSMQANEPGVGNILGYDNPAFNTWDNGYSSGGNYWSDYLTKYPDAAEMGASGIGDTPYVLNANNTDRYPLMEPFTTTPPQITLLSPVNQVYNESSVDLVFTTDEAVNWTGYSLDGKQNVTITGNSTITGIPNGSHNLIVYANDTFGNTGTSETLTFTIAVPEPFPTAFVAAVSGTSAVIVVGAGLFIYFKKRKRQA